MLTIRHALIYSWGRLIPSLVNFVAIAVYTRIASPADFGTYALTFAYATLAGTALFQWVRLSVMRLLQKEDRNSDLLPTVGLAYVALVAVVVLVNIALPALVQDDGLLTLWRLGSLVMLAQTWFDLTVDVLRAQLRPTGYGLANVVKALIAIASSTLLLYVSPSPSSLLIGAAAANIVPGLVFGRALVAGMRKGSPSTAAAASVVTYGLPLAVSLLLSATVRLSDRVMLSWYADSAVVGIYAASYDIAQNVLEALMGVAAAGGFSLAVRELEQAGRAAARAQLAQNLALLVAISAPAAVGLALVGTQFATLYLGAEFAPPSAWTIPLISLAVLMSGLRAYYVDHAFQLASQTRILVLATGAAATLNVVMNLLLIPTYGIDGAVVSTIVAYGIALALAIVASRRVFRLPGPNTDALKSAASAGLMAVVVIALPDHESLRFTLVHVTTGVVSYGTFMIALNAFGLRRALVRFSGASDGS